MVQTTLKRLLARRQKDIAVLLERFNAQVKSTFLILAADGQPLFGQSAGGTDRAPIQYDGKILGWVAGGSQGSELLAQFLSQLLALEEEKRQLADEAINRYREINLIYRLSDKLTAALELKTIALTALEEARRLINFTSGALLLIDGQTNTLNWVAGIGPVSPAIPIGEGICGQVAKTGRAEVINDVSLAAGHSPAEAHFCALLCSPLNAKGGVIGILMLAGETLISYAADDLKLLNTIASQAAPAVENALLHEATLRESRQREERLQRQIQDLRIELNENRQIKKAGEITETDYFRNLQQQADRLRQIVNGGSDESGIIG